MAKHEGSRVVCAGILLLCACGDAQGPAPVTAPLEEVFVVESVIQLGEDPADSIAEIGDFLERQDGGYLIGDRFLPRVRSYDEEGRLEAAFGRFGEGPFEFRRITAVAEAPSGTVVVADRGQSRLTYLTGALAPDTMVALPGAPRDILKLGPDLLVHMVVGEPNQGVFGHPLLLHRMAPPELMWSSFELPFSDFERPYWSSFVDYAVATGGDSTYVTSGLRYPITVIDGAGETAGTIGAPPASFRPIPVLEQGALANLASYGTTLGELLASFDVIDRIDAVGSHLVLTRGRYNPERPMPPRELLHTSLEVYDRHTGARLYEDVPLPDGSRVLAGGRFLYLLLDMHAPPWRIARLRLLTEG
ncbi:MAG: hypothetical protein F4179_01825 [Gammaproteobacteria bacterium]|nr:hypothetical protein [Gammaproteobacteria bacterium]MYF60406.1 hypothetical protein [Gammaproteobacteria bacterium]MYI23384.1 hypothetical protein [Gammaproteobacteria bacterium]